MPIVSKLHHKIQRLIRNPNKRSFFNIRALSSQLIMDTGVSMSTGNISEATPLTIGTHDGVFHCDEALGCFMLRILHPNATIVRSRDQRILDTCDIVIDVGGVYDAERNRFDHHQKSFTHSMSSVSSYLKNTVRLSSAGLVYHHFGRKILRKIIGTDKEDLLNYVYKRTYNILVQEIDGIDNGIPAYDAEPLYNINSHISARIERLNRSWNFTGDWDDMENFHKAMRLVGDEFMDTVNRLVGLVYPAREVVLDAMRKRYDVHTSGEIIELSMHCPWKDHFFELEHIHCISPPIKYVLFRGEDSYRVMGVPLTSKSFVGRKFLPVSWRGLRGEALSEKTGIEGCMFVHANGFIGGNTSREGALKMASRSLEIES